MTPKRSSSAARSAPPCPSCTTRSPPASCRPSTSTPSLGPPTGSTTTNGPRSSSSHPRSSMPPRTTSVEAFERETRRLAQLLSQRPGDRPARTTPPAALAAPLGRPGRPAPHPRHARPRVRRQVRRRPRRRRRRRTGRARRRVTHVRAAQGRRLRRPRHRRPHHRPPPPRGPRARSITTRCSTASTPTRCARPSDGQTLPPETVRRMCCDADIIPVVLDGAGVTLDVGRSRRVATADQRRALRAMYRTCGFPVATSASVTARSTTSSSGSANVARPISTTCCRSARATTTPSTKAAGH